MDIKQSSRIITIIKTITGSIMDRIELNDTFYFNLNLFLLNYRGYNEDYAKLICKDKIINSISIFRVDETFIMPDDTDIIYMIKSYKKDIYIIKNDNKYELAKEDSYYDHYYYLLIKVLNIITYENIINYSHKELLLIILDDIHFQNYHVIRTLITHDMMEDYDSMLQVCTRCEYMFIHASDRLKNNEEFVLNLMSRNALILEFVNSKMKNNYNIVLAAVTTNGLVLRFASIELRDNYDIVSTAVSQDQDAIQYASDRLKDII